LPASSLRKARVAHRYRRERAAIYPPCKMPTGHRMAAFRRFGHAAALSASLRRGGRSVSRRQFFSRPRRSRSIDSAMPGVTQSQFIVIDLEHVMLAARRSADDS
jgi:hypothetical protein